MVWGPVLRLSGLSRLPLRSARAPPFDRGVHPSCTPLETVLIDAGLIPRPREHFGRSTPHRLRKGLAAGRGRFGLHSGRTSPGDVPEGWVLSHELGELRLADPLANPTRRGYDVLLCPVPAEAGRLDGAPNPRLALACIGPWQQGEVRRHSVWPVAEHTLFTIHASVAPHLVRVDDRLEDHTLWHCLLCHEEATPAH